MNKGEDQRERNRRSAGSRTSETEKRAPQRRPVSREERMRRKRERLKRRRRIAIAVLCGLVLLLILIIAGIAALVRHFAGGSGSGKKQGQASDLTIEQQKEEDQQAEQEAEPVSITISAAGDCTLGTDENFNQSTSLNAYYDSNGPAYFFQNVKPIFDADDLTIVNMEGTLTESTSRQDKTYAFKGPAEYPRF